MLTYVLDDIFVNHRPPAEGTHPERPERAIAVRDALLAAGVASQGKALPLRRAAEEELGRVHTAGYVGELARSVPGRSGWIDADTYFSPGTWDAALAAAAAVTDVTLATLSGAATRGLAVVRPPGHHAEADRGMGFCIFNNVAIAAAAARAAGAARVAILDWDVHHGNGTQNIFYRDPSVMYLSCHQYPYYPGTGAPGESGEGPGAGTTVNVGLPAGCGDAEYLVAFDEIFVPAIRGFAPDVLLVSAGFDAYVSDPLAAMRVTRRGFRAMADRLRAVADEVAGGRMVVALEGGYDLEGLAGGMVEVLAALTAPAPAAAEPRFAPVQRDHIAGPARMAIELTRRALAAAGRPLDDVAEASA
jgi:acetoin utilization deacetylase AcuC-like enzyme